MGAREQIQENVQDLLNKIIQFNMSKRREYIDLCFDIKRQFDIDDYVEMHSYLENCCKNLNNNNEALNDLSVKDLITLEQHLKGTADLIGLNTNNVQNGTRHRSAEADIPATISHFSSQLQLLMHFIDIPIMHKNWPKNYDKLQFFNLTAEKQMEFLKRHYERSVKEGEQAKGKMAALFRRLRNEMKLNVLFSLDKRFMNVTLRNFLNLNNNSTSIYSWNDVQGDGWREIPSVGSQEHQITAPNTRVVVKRTRLSNGKINEERVYNRLNAKFCHKDGREVVFLYRSATYGSQITDYPDKGTYNYADDRGNNLILGFQTIVPNQPHDKYDVQPYNSLIKEKMRRENAFRIKMENCNRVNGGKKDNGIEHGNSYYWQYDTDLPFN